MGALFISDMNKGGGVRLSSTQKDVLFILYAIEAGGKAQPVPGVKILEMINSSRHSGIHGTNFRTSCHTLVENGLLSKYRNTSLKLAFKLTEDGRERAGEIYRKRLEEDLEK